MSATPPTPAGVTLVPVLENHRFDEAALKRYLAPKVPGFDGAIVVRQFQGGQSNPTYHIATDAGAYVLRKKPSGVLLPSAHAVDREYRVMSALAGSAVPVPKVHVLCTDDAVIGQMFYVMEYIEGRVFADRLLPESNPPERAALYDALNATLAELHKLDVAKLGLQDFGRPAGFVARQVSRWGKQWEASKTEDVPDMERVIAWLAAHVPEGDETAISHGDFRMGNLLIHPTEPRVVAVLDWELATLGHPLADLAYACMAYQLPYADGRGFGITESELEALGIPREADFVAAYCRRTGRDLPRDWRFFMAFSLFRGAAILAGVYRRALDGNAADARGKSVGGLYKTFAERAWAVAQDGATLPG